MPIDKPLRAVRGSTIRIILPDRSEISVPPVTTEQVRRCIRLDPDEGQRETDREYVERVAEQFTILVGPEHAHLTSKLTLQAVQQIVRALFVAGCGMDAEQYARWQIGSDGVPAASKHSVTQRTDLSQAVAYAEAGAQTRAAVTVSLTRPPGCVRGPARKITLALERVNACRNVSQPFLIPALVPLFEIGQCDFRTAKMMLHFHPHVG